LQLVVGAIAVAAWLDAVLAMNSRIGELKYDENVRANDANICCGLWLLLLLSAADWGADGSRHT
ncbi:MAG: hypothetical protein WA774_01895, partial [Candidatus Acidiferrales bacterium]